MISKKFIYTALAVLLIAGLAGAFVLYRMLTPARIPDVAAVAPVEESPATPARTGNPVEEKAVKEDRSDGRNPYPFVENLIKNREGQQIFGSYRVKSIIANDRDPESSRATIENLATGSSRTYSLNDTLPDNSKLVGINQDYVVLEKDGVRKRIYFAQGGTHAEAVRTRRGYSKVNDNEYNLNPYRVFRGDADRVLDFSMKIHNRDGDMEGIQISGVKKDTLAQVLGLKDGDVLLEVNSRPVDSLLGSVKACMNAYSSDDLQLKVRRGNRVVNLTYHLFWEGRGSWTPTDVLNSRAVSSLFNDASLLNIF